MLYRYQDAYRVARAINGFGIICKAIGCILAFVIVIAGFSIASNVSSSGFGASQQNTSTIITTTLIFAGLTAFAGWVVGVIIAAHGQTLKATLDTAVYASPFLSMPQKASAMSIGAASDVGRRCPGCGAALKNDARTCPACLQAWIAAGNTGKI